MAEDRDETWLNEVNTFVKLSPEFEQAVFVRYRDHVMYNRSSALLMQPQTREAIGWLVYEAERYIIISWDRDADPPTLRGGDPKASGLVLLKSDIVSYKKLSPNQQRSSELNLKSPQSIQKTSMRSDHRSEKLAKQKTPKGEPKLDNANRYFSPRYLKKPPPLHRRTKKSQPAPHIRRRPSHYLHKLNRLET